MDYTCDRERKGRDADPDRRGRGRDRALPGAWSERLRPQGPLRVRRRGGHAAGRERAGGPCPPRYLAAPPGWPRGAKAHPSPAPRPSGPDAHGPRRHAQQGGALDEGADDYLTKPFVFEELLARSPVAQA